MKIEKHLDWAPNFKNQIDISIDTFDITITNERIEIDCIWDYGCGGRGHEYMTIPLAELKLLIEELEQSEKIYNTLTQ